MLWPWQSYDDGAVEITAIEVISILKPFGKVRSHRDKNYLVLAPGRGRALLIMPDMNWHAEFPDCDDLTRVAIGNALQRAYDHGLRGRAPLLGPVTMIMPSGNAHQVPFMVWVGDPRPVCLRQDGLWTDVMPGKDAYFEP